MRRGALRFVVAPALALLLAACGRESHLRNIRQLTFGGENAEAYWSFAGDRLVFQRRTPEHGIDCDRIFLTAQDGSEPAQVSSGKGVTTCAYFLPGDDEVLYASTHGHQDCCPPPPDSRWHRRTHTTRTPRHYICARFRPVLTTPSHRHPGFNPGSIGLAASP